MDPDSQDNQTRPTLNLIADRLYAEVRALAADAMRHENPGHTLQPTALANEVFLRLSASRQSWKSDGAFIAAVAVSIRRTLVDHARVRDARKRPPRDRRIRIALDDMAAEPSTLLELDDLMARLSEREPTIARIIELQIFAGLTATQIGEIVGLNEKTVRIHRDAGRAWIRSQLWDNGKTTSE
ncbi:MAG: sigma-70 family RNA polymerase sigma factor [Planctomycetota bacterium]